MMMQCIEERNFLCVGWFSSAFKYLTRAQRNLPLSIDSLIESVVTVAVGFDASVRKTFSLAAVDDDEDDVEAANFKQTQIIFSLFLKLFYSHIVSWVCYVYKFSYLLGRHTFIITHRHSRVVYIQHAAYNRVWKFVTTAPYFIFQVQDQYFHFSFVTFFT